MHHHLHIIGKFAQYGLQGCKNRPAPVSWLDVVKGGLCRSLSYIVLLLIRATFCVLLVYVGMCSVFWLFWSSCQYLPSDWLERLFWGSLTMVRVSSPPSSPPCLWFLGLVYYFIVLWCFSCHLAVHDIFHTTMARYSLFVLKVPVKTK